MLEVIDLVKHYTVKNGLIGRGVIKAVDGVSFKITRGTTMGLVGESGSGKTTLGRAILRLNGDISGKVLFNGVDLATLKREELRKLRPKMQLIFQDAYVSLSPRMPVGEIISEAVSEHAIVAKRERDMYIDGVMRECGLLPSHRSRYPHEFSGGQRQRICIARALALNPEFIVCDEPTSALDVSVQAQMINLLRDLQAERKLTYLFISHDLSVVKHMCDDIAVMYMGKLVELAGKRELFEEPMHPYTKALMSSIPSLDPDRRVSGAAHNNIERPQTGCGFHPRCAECTKRCRYETPEMREISPGHFVACHLA